MRETRNPEEIRGIACHPSVWPGFGGGDMGGWQPQIRPGYVWLVGDGVLALFIRIRLNAWEYHVGALPDAQDVRAKALQAISLVRSAYGGGFLLGYVKRDNKPALVSAKAIGMKVLLQTPDTIMVGQEF